MTQALRAPISGLLIASLALTAAAPLAALEVGAEAPAFALPQRSGGELALADLRGRVVIVDFWASWCAPCRESFPFLDELQRRHHDAGLSVVGINLDEQRDEAERFLRERPVGFQIVYDPEATTPERFGVRTMPSSYVIGRDGKVRAVHSGFRERDRGAFEAEVSAALAEPVAP
jgi:thiol-disulfide isomerase/thioredoxin